MRTRRNRFDPPEEPAPSESVKDERKGAGSSPSAAATVKLSEKALSRNQGKRKISDGLSCETSVKAWSAGHMKESTPIEDESTAVSNFNGGIEMDWKDGTIHDSGSQGSYSHELGKTITIEFFDSLPTSERKRIQRASAEEKELAEVVHKVHLLVLLARGRIIDKACNDPLIQASILSLLPVEFINIAEIPRVTAQELEPVVKWFNRSFRVTSNSTDTGSFKSNLEFALQARQGTAEEVAALSVSLFRSLNLQARYVANFNVASPKPDGSMPGSSIHNASKLDTRALPCTSTAVTSNAVHANSNLTVTNGGMAHQDTGKNSQNRKKKVSPCKKKLFGHSASDSNIMIASGEACSDSTPTTSNHAQGPKRKGDLEFERQLEMALTATNVMRSEKDEPTDIAQLPAPNIIPQASSTPTSWTRGGCSNSVWSKAGPPLCWAEVYCNGETLMGRWVHVDAAAGIVDGEDKVEAACAVCRRPLIYAVAFARSGAKDVTRRYCLQWYRIASKRVDPQWWDKVLAPLKELEAAGTMCSAEVENFFRKDSPNARENLRDDYPTQVLNTTTVPQAMSDISNVEDMELETRALTEPLPTNQQAYKNHPLYALERWLVKNQVLHPKGPILGYCSGHPVYPRTCVRTLQSRQKWFKEGWQVRPNELPAKMVKHSKKTVNAEQSEFSSHEENKPTIELFGRWQLEPLQLPPAVDGIVPKNERGQVEAWSEKCLPPGTVHLKLPRLDPVAKRLEIDYAPAMVGFEFRNGRSLPIFEGIVVCAEFKDAILEAYAEEEARREAGERRRDEKQALAQWFQLISSIVTRERLQNSYAGAAALASKEPDVGASQTTENLKATGDSHREDHRQRGGFREHAAPSEHHEHTFPVEDQSFDEETLMLTKRCPCGLTVEVEEL